MELPARLVMLTADEFRSRLNEALDIYVSAMRYAPGTAQQRRPMWLDHIRRAGWCAVGALGDNDALLGVAYGYQGIPGQWWHDEVRRGLTARDPELVGRWLSDYFELTELHVRPDTQGNGLGEALLRLLLSEVASTKVLLSTPEGNTRAWNLYRRMGFHDVLRNYRFSGDPRPFAVLGRPLPL